MEEREKLEDAMMQKAMVAELKADVDEDQILGPPLASRGYIDDDEVEELLEGDGTIADMVDSAIQNIELSKKTLDWWNRALGQYKDMFHLRMRSLMAGRQSYALCKRLQGSDVPIFESKLYGHRILWSFVKRDATTSILVRHVYNLSCIPVGNHALLSLCSSCRCGALVRIMMWVVG
jgi:hypothetical protein